MPPDNFIPLDAHDTRITTGYIDGKPLHILTVNDAVTPPTLCIYELGVLSSAPYKTLLAAFTLIGISKSRTVRYVNAQMRDPESSNLDIYVKVSGPGIEDQLVWYTVLVDQMSKLGEPLKPVSVIPTNRQAPVFDQQQRNRFTNG